MIENNEYTGGFKRKRLKGGLKEYYEIVDEARPLSGFFPTHADFFIHVEKHL